VEAGKRTGLLSYIGIEIGGTKLQLARADRSGVIGERRKLTVDSSKGAPGIRDQIERILPGLMAQFPVEAIGVGFGGPVDWQTGRICRSHQVEGWSEFDLAGWLQKLSRSPVLVDNDANVAALGECRHGAAREFNPAFYITLGSGVGGGLVVDGKIFHGTIPGEAEIGHLRLDRDGTTVESRCSGWAIDSRIRARKSESTLLSRLLGTSAQGEARVLSAALEQGDTVAGEILAELTDDLAFGLSHVVHLFHPQIVVLGGGLSGIGEPLRAGVESALCGFVMEAFAPGPRISLAALGEDAVPVGAVELARAATGETSRTQRVSK
jgi:glucokinase